ncbi:MAG: hypothetical protein K6U88_16065 [Dehalococcoidia bacterium]|nr:hypothetical protein [Dehalococcoidia bacterium]
MEELVAAARTAAGLDSIERALGTGAFGEALFVTDRPDAAPDPPAGVQILRSPEPFHFGTALTALIAERKLERVVYFGSGAVSLLGAEEFRSIAERLAQLRAFDRKRNAESGT